MEMLYWAAEYGKVLGGYVFLMFVWPMVVFGRHLKRKTGMYRFGFCVTAQIVLVNTAVLIPGLFHILNRKLIVFLFYGAFVWGLCMEGEWFRSLARSIRRIESVFRFNGFRPGRWIRGLVWDLWWRHGNRLLVYPAFGAVVMLGMAYFSYGAFQVGSYGGGDLYTHHAWIYGLMEGRIFADGIYPEAMHCFVYCLNALFGIRVDSILLFLQNIHITVFFVSAYFLMRQVFAWRYTPIFVLALFVTLDVVSADEIYGMYRLQMTLPLEFGLHTQFLCALYLLRYLKGEGGETVRGRRVRYRRSEDLFLLASSVAASVAVHYYTTIMAVVMCASFAAFSLKRLFSKRYLAPVMTAAVCGFAVAAMPMAGAFASGIPFNYSITWALNAMDGSETRELDEKLEEAAGETGEEKRPEADGAGKTRREETPEDNADAKAGRKETREDEAGAEAGDKEEGALPDAAGSQVKTPELGSGRDGGYPMKKSEAGIWQGKVTAVYDKGYTALYGQRTGLVLLLTAVSVMLCLSGRRNPDRLPGTVCRGYPPAILLSFFYILLYAAPFMGLPEVISDSRFCSTGHMMILAVMMIPIDALIAAAVSVWGERFLFHLLSFLAPAGIYAAVILTGNYHGYLFYEMTRCRQAVAVTNRIIEEFPAGSFVVVAPTDELYPVSPYGWHEELLSFVRNSENGEYFLPTQHIFIYVEKKPFRYSQAHFFTGPSWLAEEKYQDIYWDKYSKKYPEKGSSQAPEVDASQISVEAAQTAMEELDKGWRAYTRLDRRTALESKAYGWCRRFAERYPMALKVYYEDEDFVCYYLEQEPGEEPYNLGME